MTDRLLTENDVRLDWVLPWCPSQNWANIFPYPGLEDSLVSKIFRKRHHRRKMYVNPKCHEEELPLKCAQSAFLFLVVKPDVRLLPIFYLFKGSHVQKVSRLDCKSVPKMIESWETRPSTTS